MNENRLFRGGTRIGSYALCTQLAMRLVESIRAKVPNRGHLLHRAGCSGNVPLNPLGTAAHGGPAVGWPVGELVEGAVARRRVVVRLWLVRAGTAARPVPSRLRARSNGAGRRGYGAVHLACLSLFELLTFRQIIPPDRAVTIGHYRYGTIMVELYFKVFKYPRVPW